MSQIMVAVQRNVAQDGVSAGARFEKLVGRQEMQCRDHYLPFLSVGGAVSSVLAFSDTSLTASKYGRQTG